MRGKVKEFFAVTDFSKTQRGDETKAKVIQLKRKRTALNTSEKSK